MTFVIADTRRDRRSPDERGADLTDVVRERIAFWEVLARAQRRPLDLCLYSGAAARWTRVATIYNNSSTCSSTTCSGTRRGRRGTSDERRRERTAARGSSSKTRVPESRRRALRSAKGTGRGLEIARRVARDSAGALTIGKSDLGGARVEVGLGPRAGLMFAAAFGSPAPRVRRDGVNDKPRSNRGQMTRARLPDGVNAPDNEHTSAVDRRFSVQLTKTTTRAFAASLAMVAAGGTIAGAAVFHLPILGLGRADAASAKRRAARRQARRSGCARRLSRKVVVKTRYADVIVHVPAPSAAGCRRVALGCRRRRRPVQPVPSNRAVPNSAPRGRRARAHTHDDIGVDHDDRRCARPRRRTR